MYYLFFKKEEKRGKSENQYVKVNFNWISENIRQMHSA